MCRQPPFRSIFVPQRGQRRVVSYTSRRDSKSSWLRSAAPPARSHSRRSRQGRGLCSGSWHAAQKRPSQRRHRRWGVEEAAAASLSPVLLPVASEAAGLVTSALPLPSSPSLGRVALLLGAVSAVGVGW